jgi:hypothetical protein
MPPLYIISVSAILSNEIRVLNSIDIRYKYISYEKFKLVLKNIYELLDPEVLDVQLYYIVIGRISSSLKD